MIRDVDETTHLGITPDGPRAAREPSPSRDGRFAKRPAGGANRRRLCQGLAFRQLDRFALPLPGSAIVESSAPLQFRVARSRSLKQWSEVVAGQMQLLPDLAEAWAVRIQQHGERAEPPEFPQPAELQHLSVQSNAKLTTWR
jgi:hypothetical protein